MKFYDRRSTLVLKFAFPFCLYPWRTQRLTIRLSVSEDVKMMQHGRSRPAAPVTVVQLLPQWLLPQWVQNVGQLPHPLQLPLLLLSVLLLLAASECDAALLPSMPQPTLPAPAQRLLSANRGGGVCPCAYLERGGFWNSDIAAGLGVVNGIYVENRCRCTYDFNCARQWQQSSKSVTVAWVGSLGVSSSQIQLQFCSSIYDSALVTCAPDKVTFSLRQLGWWLDLQGVFCRCPGPGTPAIHRFIYARPVAYNDPFNGRLVDFVCESKPVCQTDEWCYEELLDSERQMTHGSVMCTCPAGAFCPIYSIGAGARVPMYANGTVQPVIGYRLLCRPEATV